MKIEKLTPTEAKFLLVLAVFGALIPNGIFCYYFLTSPEVTRAALTNPISLVFIVEAFILMFLFAWLLFRSSSKRPGGAVFIILSLLGSMIFSVPTTLYLILKNRKEGA